MRVRPTFINIGPGRCGTSWLHEVLAAHPEIGMGTVKETEYFNTNYDKGAEWYENHFAHLSSKRAIGEVSNNYYLDAQVAERIRNYRPDIKIIVNLRDPIDLLRSYYEFGQRRGLQFQNIEAALNEPVGRVMGSGYDYRLKRDALTAADQVSLLDSVMLHDLIRPFLDTFPDDQIYFFVYEKFRQEPKSVLKEVYDFLGVDPSFQPNMMSEVVNQSISPRSPLIASMGSTFAFLLRRVGAYHLLSALHKSRLFKRVFFKPAGRKGPRSGRGRPKLGNDTIARLSEETKRLRLLIPEFAYYSDSN